MSSDRDLEHRNEIFVDTILSRYVRDIARSKYHVHDLYPPIFFDGDELKEHHFAYRFEVVSDDEYGNREHGIARSRYERMDNPPVLLVQTISRSSETSLRRYRLNRTFFESDPYYATDAYRLFYSLLLSKLKNQMKLKIPLRPHPVYSHHSRSRPTDEPR